MGDAAKAAYYKTCSIQNMPAARPGKCWNNPAALNTKNRKPLNNTKTTSFEGKFDEALGEKKADSVFGQNYWTPQLLYIEALR